LISTTDGKPLSPEAHLLLDRIKDEFSKTTIRRWGHFFPILVATIRFIFQARPKAIGDIDARYDSSPAFSGRGAEWLVDTLLYSNEYLNLVEPIWYQIVKGITAPTKAREYILIDEIPKIDPIKIEQLASLILDKVDQGIENGTIV